MHAGHLLKSGWLSKAGRGAASGLGRFFGLGVDYRCRACLGVAQGPKDDLGLCPECAAELAMRRGGFCPRCGELFADSGDIPHLCAACLAKEPAWDGLAFYGEFRGTLRDLILAYKFNVGLGHGRLLRELIMRGFAQWTEVMPDLAVPVPLSAKRLRWRGYNQSFELCRGFKARLGLEVSRQALTRIRHTIPQTRLSGRQRRDNLKNAFAADPSRVKGKRVLLVDDVMTTGATIHECSKTLRKAGAEAVDVLVLARSRSRS